MSKSIIRGAILGAIIVYVWMFISWMVLPWTTSTLKQFKNEEFVGWVLKTNAKKSGVYVIPHPKTVEEHGEGEEKSPQVFVSIKRKGINYTGPKVYIASFIINLIAAGLVSFLLTQVSERMRYGGKLVFVTIFGLTAGVLCYLPGWNWWGYSMCYTLVGIANSVIGWFLAGIVLARVVKSRYSE